MSRRLPFALLVVALALPSAARAQDLFPQTHTVPHGVLRFSFEPSYTTYDHLFDQAGDQIPFGAYLSADTLGAPFFPSLVPAQDSLRALMGNPAFRLDAGALTTHADADVRHFPLSASLGVSDRLTLTATVPIVVTRVRAYTKFDTTGANAAVNGQGDQQLWANLIAQINSAADAVDANIALGNYGCPGTATCAAAIVTVTRARALAAQLESISGANLPADAPVPPLVPRAGSAAGTAIANAVQQISTDLAALGASPISAPAPLPPSASDTASLNGLFTDTRFGYGIAALNPSTPIKRTHVGDVELGLQYALANGAHTHALFTGSVRLPTGHVDSTDDVLDIPTGTHALGLTGGLTLVLDPGARLGLAFQARYTHQFSSRLVRRIASPADPLVLASDTATVNRRLGDEIFAGVYPSLRLNPAFRVYVAVNYYHKAMDSYSAVGSGPTPQSISGATVSDLGNLTNMTSWSFGGGISYRSLRGTGPGALPIEAQVGYRAGFAGSGGLTPKPVVLSISLRLFYRLWGGEAAPSEEQPAPAPAAPPPSQ